MREVSVKTNDEVFSANKVIITVPVKLLQQGEIRFIPELPDYKQHAIEKVKVWDGGKAFIEFSDKFYPTFIESKVTPSRAGQKLYYDAAYGQDSAQHILGLFAVGKAAHPYLDLNDAALIEYMLNELDQIFDGKASRHYVKHIFQNWNAEPYAKGAYVMDDENWMLMRKLGKSINDQLFFAGDAYYTGMDWGSVHVAARSANRAVKAIMNS